MVGQSGGETTGVRPGSASLRSLYRLSLVTVTTEIFWQTMEVDRFKKSRSDHFTLEPLGPGAFIASDESC